MLEKIKVKMKKIFKMRPTTVKCQICGGNVSLYSYLFEKCKACDGCGYLTKERIDHLRLYKRNSCDTCKYLSLDGMDCDNRVPCYEETSGWQPAKWYLDAIRFLDQYDKKILEIRNKHFYVRDL